MTMGAASRMELLLDSDVLCKLAAADLLADTVKIFGLTIPDCRRLPALPHMLRRGSLRRHLGDELCNKILPMVEAIAPVQGASIVWLDKLAQVPEIDPGEAQLFAVAAERGSWIATGDKRSLSALARIPDYVAATSGRIVIPERVLITLCCELGVAEMHKRIQPVTAIDKVVRICFSENPGDPPSALLSYSNDAEISLSPLTFWKPE